VDINIQMKSKNGDQWDNIYPKTKTDMVEGLAERLAEKASLSYVDALLGSLGNGAPKEAFFSLSALIAKYPNGTTGPMLVFDTAHHDGAHVYIWSTGTSLWEDIGTYQGIEVVDGTVSLSKLSLDLQDFINDWQAVLTTENEPWEV